MNIPKDLRTYSIALTALQYERIYLSISKTSTNPLLSIEEREVYKELCKSFQLKFRKSVAGIKNYPNEHKACLK